MDIDEFVALSVKHNASDLHLCAGHPPMLRIDGELQPLAAAPTLTAQGVQALCDGLLNAQQRESLRRLGQVDLALHRPSGERLRANVFQQSAGISLALRRIAGQSPSLAELAAPAIVPALLRRADGLILVTGATGSGKSTTLAAMIDEINRHQPRHVLTLEDPIEFLHRSRRSLIQQREIGRDSHSFDAALRAALREDPDVILLGELRDTATIRLALTAAETGHLVLATLHTRSAPQAVERLVMVNPIGLEDWKAKGVPWRSIDQWFARELNTSAESIRNYELHTYYGGRWKPEYDRWVDMLAGLNNGPGHRLVAWNSALIYDMIFTQPVYYEFKDLQTPTTLMIGTADTTAIGSDIAPPAVKAKIGHYDVLGKQAAKLIPHATLIEFAGLGHAPQMEEPERFHQALLKALQP
ncbi:PilT/PilU family type 4a pilus ATPase [Serratia marcescens]|uniref:PilT/PilU family type 4a pilus ATPase n=1 Tax=Serratia marcescens TaxID=615 RepID=UPI000F7DF68D|nr:PilT/PilU family type 4a pilus ATPase [Serratia marcescens]RTF95838.1 PilT/PilU family type 4a pilus ATPase [Serratia marcescens]